MRKFLNRRLGLILAAGALFVLGVSWQFGDNGPVRGPASSKGCSHKNSGGGGTPLPTPTSTGGGNVCTRWNSDRADLSEGTFTGNISACDPGDYTGPGRANTLKLINLYRWMAQLPAVTDDANMNHSAQACSLLITANGQLDHNPPSNWKCYPTGASGAGSSNEATAKAVGAIDMYIQDGGNEQTMGHRRWILSNGLTSVGIGSTNAMSCLQIVHGFGGGPAYTAFPGNGDFPIQAVQGNMIWTIQSDTIDLSNAQVTVKEGGTDKPVTTLPLLQYYGSSSAVGFMPNGGYSGWYPQAGHTYSVTVSGVTPSISYNVHMVACAASNMNVRSLGLEQPVAHQPAKVTVSWFQPAASAGFGPAGSIAVSGTAQDGSGGVQIEYRVADSTDLLAVQPWRLANGGFAAQPNANHAWTNSILPPLGRYYQVRARYGGVVSQGQCTGSADYYTQCTP